MAILGLAVVWYFFPGAFSLGGDHAEPVPKVQVMPQTAQPSKPSDEAQKTERQASFTALPGQSYLGQSSDLRELTALQSALELEKLRVSVEEERAKRMDIKGSPLYVPPLPQVVMTPDQFQDEQPTEGQNDANAVEQAAKRQEEAAKAAVPNRLVAVRGMNGNLVAKVANGYGVKTLRVGDRFGSGTVESISLDSVTLRRKADGGLETIYAED